MNEYAPRPWLTRAALAADRRAVDRAMSERGAPIGTLLAVVPALLRLVASAEPKPEHATPGFSLACDHGTRGWVATIAGAVDTWTGQHEDIATAVRLMIQRVLLQLDAWERQT